MLLQSNNEVISLQLAVVTSPFKFMASPEVEANIGASNSKGMLISQFNRDVASFELDSRCDKHSDIEQVEQNYASTSALQ